MYGVEVPGHEGKSGMATISDPEKTTNVENLPQALDQILPKYAQPQFVRVSAKPMEVLLLLLFSLYTMIKSLHKINQ